MTDITNENLNNTDDSFIFTRLAESEIKNGNHEKAQEILIDGLNKFPNYLSAQILLGKIKISQNKNEEAREAFQNALDLIGFQPTAEYYLSLIPKIEINAAPEQVEELEVEENVAEEDDLGQLANKLSNAKMDVPYLNEAKTETSKDSGKMSQNNSGRSLVSETLARIYVSQENFKEAIEIYETLIEIQPEREDYYRSKLDEINSRTGAVS